MSNFFILNASDTEIFISLNGDGYINVPAAKNDTWAASRQNIDIEFINRLKPASGQLGIGDNDISVYSATGGASNPTKFILRVPEGIRIYSIQLYLFWKNATSVAWVALNSGQPFQVSFTTENSDSITKTFASKKQMISVENNTLSSPPYTITACL